jgi:eukaryotic-like serine/threonine-protein kinase
MRWPPLALESAPETTVDGQPTPTPPIPLGAVVAAKYRVEHVIGYGGMGVVCLATHVELGTPVAVKFVRAELGSDERAVARFLTEARAAAQLRSQHACRVADYGRLPSGSPYIVMEYLVGQDLRARVESRGPMSVEDAVSVALQACEALAEAHSKHIVHRDVKPENLFLSEGPGGAESLKVLDFGISKQVSPLGVPRAMTDSMEGVGSPAHMSPEQMLDPSSVDFRTDIWSLGVVLYEILTGQLPFAGESGPQLCANVMTTLPISPQAHRADIPDGLARVILSCLEKDRELRFRDIGELSRALQEFGGADAALAATRVEQIFGREVASHPASAANVRAPRGEETLEPLAPIPGLPRRGMGRLVGVGLVVLLATGLAGYAVRRTVTPVKPVERAAPTPPRAASEPLQGMTPLPPPARPLPSSAPGKATTPSHRVLVAPRPLERTRSPVAVGPASSAPPPAPAPTPDPAPTTDATDATEPTEPTEPTEGSPATDTTQAPVVYPVLKPVDLPTPPEVAPP